MIKVTDKYYIAVSDCYTVYERSIAKSGKNQGSETFGNASYFPTMTMALNNIIGRTQKDKLSGDDVISLKEAIEILTDVQKEFTDIVKGLENYE